MRRMASSPGDHRRRHLSVAAAILLAGLVAATFIYLRAGGGAEALLELSPETSKKYLRDLEMYGGTANVLAVEFSAWFAGLWHGRRLAYTTATLSFLGSLAYLFFTLVLPPYEDPGEPEHGEDGQRR